MRLSLRARITVMFIATVLGVGLALIGLVYAYLKLTPVPVMASFPGADDGVVIDGAVPVTDEILRRILLASLGALALLARADVDPTRRPAGSPARVGRLLLHRLVGY